MNEIVYASINLYICRLYLSLSVRNMEYFISNVFMFTKFTHRKSHSFNSCMKYMLPCIELNKDFLFGTNIFIKSSITVFQFLEKFFYNLSLLLMTC